jgi:hypothetical protein
METDRLARLERRVELLDLELAGARSRIAALERGGGWVTRAGHMVRLPAACGIVVIAALTLGTAAAAPKPQALTVKAPFQVLNSAGTLIFSVSGDKTTGGGVAKIYSAAGDTVAALQTSEAGSGGELAVGGDTAGQKARLGGNGTQLALRFYQGGTLLGGVGANADGGLLQLNNKAGKPMAKLANNGNGGTVGIYGGDGKPRIVMAANSDTGRGALDILGDSGGPAVTLKATENAGYFAIANAAGTARVEAGVLNDDKGIVRTYGPKGFDFVRGK